MTACLALTAAYLALTASALAQTPTSFEWSQATPESQGISTAKLTALKDAIADRTKALLVIRNDKIVFEWYSEGRTARDKHYTASMAKAIVGGLSLAVALNDGLIALDDKAFKYVPQWKDHPLKSQITIRHLGSHTSGIKDSQIKEESARGINQQDFSGWEGEFWRWRTRNQSPPGDAFSISRDVAPVLFAPGTEFHYSNPGIAMLTYCVTASLKGKEHADVRTLLQKRIMQPIGVSDEEWSCGYEKTETVDGLPLVGSWGGGSYTPRAVARIGRLMLREGDWEGKQFLRKEAIRQITTDAGTPGNGAMGWWSNNSSKYAKLPKDAFWGSGAGHQVMLVVPSLNLMVVRNGEGLRTEQEHDDALNARLFEPLLDALADRPQQSSTAPYPTSKVITGIAWAPQETIVRKAPGGDNWPLTWADDGHLYAAYGDGNGFEPVIPEKLSMGLCRIEGTPKSFTGINLRSPTFESKGEGVAGRKASGMLMVDGVLYMLVRNAGNAQLAWSGDHGKTWAWADWKWKSSFGCPTFLNFGKNYAGARDDFVYIYSHDSDSAYEPADRMVLARVRKDRIRERQAYEFFTRLDPQGKPQWAGDINQRGAVFTHSGRCYRSGITYNAALKRYLWCQILPESTDQDTRFQGGFGIYDAPEPWGPWRTVYFTNEWDVGPGEASSFPTKWMSADGRTLHLVFSGDDYFSVRRASLTIAN